MASRTRKDWENRIKMKQRADKETIQDLRRAVELKVGFDITSTRDCEVLSMEIERFDRRFSLSVLCGLVAGQATASVRTPLLIN